MIEAVILSRPEALDAWQPRERCIIACLIFSRMSNSHVLISADETLFPEAEVWVRRTYEVYKDGDGWRIDFGEGGHHFVPTWDRVVSWFCKMNPRNIEVLIDG